MAEKHAGWELAKWIAITLAVLSAAYVGAYCWMIDYLEEPRMGKPGFIVFHKVPRYYWNSNGINDDRQEELSARLAPLFAPLHGLDRRIRPAEWEAREMSSERPRPIGEE